MEFNKKTGSEFIGIKNYTSKKGEVSDQTLIIGVDVLNAKKLDLKALQGLSIDHLYTIADKVGVDHKIADKALAELLISGTKNVSTEIENRTIASQSQTETYQHINKGMKVNLESGILFVSGFAHSKTIHINGVYPTVNKQSKTIIKDAIKNELKFKMNKYRNFTFKDANEYKINGSTLEVKK